MDPPQSLAWCLLPPKSLPPTLLHPTLYLAPLLIWACSASLTKLKSSLFDLLHLLRDRHNILQVVGVLPWLLTGSRPTIGNVTLASGDRRLHYSTCHHSAIPPATWFPTITPSVTSPVSLASVSFTAPDYSGSEATRLGI